MEKVTLDPKLESLIRHCTTICEPGCCGIDACDFSPFHLATFLMYGGKKEIPMKDVQTLDDALLNVLKKYGPDGASSDGTLFKSINYLSSDDVAEWVAKVRVSMKRAVELINQEYGLV